MTDVHPALSIDFLRDNPRCDWFRVSQVKSGPRLRYACKFCAHLSRTKTCHMDITPEMRAAHTAEVKATLKRLGYPPTQGDPG